MKAELKEQAIALVRSLDSEVGLLAFEVKSQLIVEGSLEPALIEEVRERRNRATERANQLIEIIKQL